MSKILSNYLLKWKIKSIGRFKCLLKDFTLQLMFTVKKLKLKTTSNFLKQGA